MILREVSLWGNLGGDLAKEALGHRALQSKLLTLMVEIFIIMMVTWDLCLFCRNLKQFKYFLSLQGRDCTISDNIQKLYIGLKFELSFIFRIPSYL